jgi:hypothetical protein
MANPVSLGNIDLKGGPPAYECEDCQSRNVKRVPGELTKEYIADFVRNRAQRLGLALADYDIKIDKSNGAITAIPKKVEVDFELS